MFEIEKPSPNHLSRNGFTVRAIILHATEGKTLEGDISWLRNPKAMVSSHVVIARSGDVYRLVPDDLSAWHAGHSNLFGAMDSHGSVNSFSLGVELEHETFHSDYSPEQITATVQWCAEKAFQYSIPLNMIVGHLHVAPGRKTDPESFPWKRFLLEVGKLQSLWEL